MQGISPPSSAMSDQTIPAPQTSLPPSTPCSPANLSPRFLCASYSNLLSSLSLARSSALCASSNGGGGEMMQDLQSSSITGAGCWMGEEGVLSGLE
jgi:hypothetical protein